MEQKLKTDTDTGITERAASHFGALKTAMSVEDVARQARNLSEKGPDKAALDALAGNDIQLRVENLHAGYGKMEILHGFDLAIGRGRSLCIIGPNGAGKSTVLHSIFGFTDIFSGRIVTNGKDVTHLSPKQKLKQAGIAYILQNNSVFPDMTVEENLWLGGYLKDRNADAKEAAEKIFAKYDRLGQRRSRKAGTLSGGERRLLEIARALIMSPEILLVDEPSIGLEPRFIDMVFEILADLQKGEGKTIILVEQNAKKGLEFADMGYVLVAGQLAIAGPAGELIDNPEIGRLFLGA
jgi:branched-chain amino acid transport system ATP-binding protein